MRGLESLIPPRRAGQREDVKIKESVFLIETSNIHANPFQPRKEFDPVELKNLADSIKQYGILQPLIVQKIEEEVPSGRKVSYELIAGERRLRAAKLARVPQVPVIVRGVKNNEKLEISLIENIQRHDLNALEEAFAYQRLQKEFGLNQAEIAKRVGKSRSAIANTLRILNLPKEIQDALAAEKISDGHTRPILSLQSETDQRKLFKEICEQNMSVRVAEDRSREMLARSAPELRLRHSAIDPELRELTEQLRSALASAKVHVRADEYKVRLALEFGTRRELVSLLQKMLHNTQEA